MNIAAGLACVILLSTFSNCGSIKNQKSSGPYPSNERCLWSSDDQISQAIDSDLKIIVAERAEASSCSNAPPSPCPIGTGSFSCPGPGSLTAVRSAYNRWLSDVGSGIQSANPPAIGQPPQPYEGLGPGYKADADAAQGLFGYVAACQDAVPGISHPQKDPCGKDTACQQAVAEEKSFVDTGTTIVRRFRGCSSDVRATVSNYLQNHYTW